MRITVSKMAADVRALRNESLAALCEPEEGVFPDLEFQISLLAPGILAEIIRESLPEMLSGWRKISSPFKYEGDGKGMIILPGDFYMLGNLRLRSWKMKIDRPAEPSPQLLGMQASSTAGVRGSTERPVVVLDLTAEGEKCLRIFGCKDDDSIETGLYLPYPAFIDEAMEVAEALYPQLLKKLAEYIAL